MFGGEDFLVRAHMQAAVDHRQSFCGAAGQGDLAGLGIQVLACPDANVMFAAFGFLQVPVHRQARIAVDVRTMLLDGVAHRFGVRSDQEVGKVNVVRVLIEQLFKARPFVCGGWLGRCF